MVKAGVVRHDLVLVAYEAVVEVAVEAVVEAVVETAVEVVVGLLAVDLVNSAHAVYCLSIRPSLL